MTKVGALSRLNAETLERAPTPLFGEKVRCSTHGRTFARVQYIEKRYVGGLYTSLFCAIILHIFFHYTRVWKKISVGGLYTSLFCAIIPTLFPYFLPFWYPYILLHFQIFFITCDIMTVIELSDLMKGGCPTPSQRR